MSMRGVWPRTGLAILPLCAGLALSAAAQPSDSFPTPDPDPAGGPQAAIVDFPENSALRVASLGALFGEDVTAGASGWRLSGPDAALFEIDAGALRFAVGLVGDSSLDSRRLLPDFEAPGDADGDNRYELTAAATAADGETATRRVTVRVTDRDEPGRVRLSAARPEQGVTLTAALADPDGPLGPVSWTWERSTGRDAFAAIVDANDARYTPAAADTGRLLRAVARYADRHGGADGAGNAKQASAVARAAVLGPRLLALSARSENFPGRGLHPAFDPAVTHYALPCAERDVLSLEWTAPASARADVNGVQPRPGAAGVAAQAVTDASDVILTLATADGAATRYTIHCVPESLAGIRTRVASTPEPLLTATARAWAAVIDERGVPRFHRRAAGDGSTGFFLKTYGAGAGRRWAHGAPPEDAPPAPGAWAWTLHDADFSPLREIAAAPPLTVTGRHDFQLLEDGGALLMAYEPAVRDFSWLSAPAGGPPPEEARSRVAANSFAATAPVPPPSSARGADARAARPGPTASVPFNDPDGQPWGSAVQTQDSAVQIVGPDGGARWTWNSWGRAPLEDCAQHWFPRDYAHVNSAQMTPAGVLASLRGCSSVLLLDPEAPPGEEIVWRVGQSNLAAEDYAARGLGPAPWPVVGDPEGAFCGQHSASLVSGHPEPRLLLFDNGEHCVADPSTGEPLSRRGGTHSRAVEYALDHEHGEAAFVREHSLDGRRGAFAGARGHVEALPGGGWLVSWGRPSAPDSEDARNGPGAPEVAGAARDSSGGNAPDAASGTPAMVSLVDPASGVERFAVLRGEQVGMTALTALTAPRAALLEDLPPLGASFPDGALLADAPGGSTAEEVPGANRNDAPDSPDLLWLAVAFTRPVVDFGADTPSVEIENGALAQARPWRAFGKPANGYLLGLRAEGGGPLTLRLHPGRDCASGGICAADDTPLTQVPPPLALAQPPAAAQPPATGAAR